MLVGYLISQFCSVPLFRDLCRGWDLQLGHIPTYYSWVFQTPTLPIVGAVGLEAVLNVANQVWSRIGLFDGGFGIEIEETFFAEFFLGFVRIEVFGAGLEFKMDLTWCTTCSISVAGRMVDSVGAWVDPDRRRLQAAREVYC
jgi:hypothetical protein